MINGKRVIAIVTARAGSRGIRNKNLIKVGGVSIVGRAVTAGCATPEVDRVIVSTDGKAIGEEARAFGAEVMHRPEHLANDTAIVKDVVVDIRARLREEGETAEIMVLLEPTSPLRSPEDVSECIQKLENDELDTVATFTDASIHPHRTWVIDEGGAPRTFIPGAVPWTPRQLLPPAFELNGAVYCFRLDGVVEHDGPSLMFGRSGAVLMPHERSVDIDTITDVDIANAILNRMSSELEDDEIA